MIRIVAEAPGEAGAREALLDRAFGPGRHLKTSARVRAGRMAARGLSFCAKDESGRLVGTVRLWNVALGDGCDALLLGPLAVDPAAQGAGVGAKLMHHALAEALFAGHRAVILVGDPEYYGRFGFEASLAADLALPGPVERRRFLGFELVPGALDGAHGMVTACGAMIPTQELAMAS